MSYRLSILLPTFLAVYAVCYFTAFLVRFDFALDSTTADIFRRTLPFVLLVRIVSSAISREWQRRFRYTNLADLLFVGGTTAGATAVILLCNELRLTEEIIPRSVIAIDFILCVMGMTGLRGSWRVYCETVQPWIQGQQKIRTLIYGADEAGVGILRAIQATAHEHRVVGFLNEVPTRKSGYVVAGVPVVGRSKGLARAARRLRATQLLIPSTVPGQQLRPLLAACEEAELRAHVIPAVDEIVAGRIKMTFQEVTISDLLRREPTELDLDGIRGYVSNRTVLVSGAAGSIGSEVCRQLLALSPRQLIFVDQSESGIFEIEQEVLRQMHGVELHFVVADVCNKVSMERIFEEFLPQIVFHAAAYKHVPMMETNPQEAVRNNVLGTRLLVDLADRFRIDRFVLISTDKAVRPTSVMGSTKLVAEKYLQAVSGRSKTRFITVRFGNVLNSAGSVVPTFRKQIMEGGPLTVTHPEMTRYFMTIPEAVQLVIQAGAVGQSGDILILDMGEPVKIVDLAKDMIFLSGLKHPDDIDIVFSGVRPGEKLYEELFYATEEGAKKVHEKIFCAPREAVRLDEINSQLRRLEASFGSRAECLNTLQEIVNSYVERDQQRDKLPLPSAA
ncbi:MAG: nucleoside-diphosphate sugar epimerase/dehydratase [Planctomycetota bacterium]|nr:nucleoside-diphosphate sugar epimerase/dehydratase [Planctomycetota bacterium]